MSFLFLSFFFLFSYFPSHRKKSKNFIVVHKYYACSPHSHCCIPRHSALCVCIHVREGRDLTMWPNYLGNWDPSESASPVLKRRLWTTLPDSGFSHCFLSPQGIVFSWSIPQIVARLGSHQVFSAMTTTSCHSIRSFT